MRDLGKISEADYRRARKEPVRARTTPANGLVAPYFVDYVRAELERNADIELADLHGVRVYTTLDPVLQRIAEAAVVKGMDRLETLRPRLRRKTPEERLQAAMIVLVTATGQVRALVGGRDYRSSQFNRAVLARRQPGSAFKPFVYLAAVTPRQDTSQFTAASLIEDAPITVMVDGKPWTPKNYDDRYEGPVTVRRALEG
jgi:membrane peptidoglycan carboxypeptidase